jgi:hypothetical protein
LPLRREWADERPPEPGEWLCTGAERIAVEARVCFAGLDSPRTPVRGAFEGEPTTNDGRGSASDVAV